MRNGLDPEAAWDSLDMILHACLADWVMSLAGDTNTLLSQLWLLVGVTSSELQYQGRGASTSLNAPIAECKQDLLLTFRVCMLNYFSHVQLFATPWTIACRSPLCMGFSRQEYWSGLPWPPPGALLDPGIEPASLISPALASGFFTSAITWEALLLSIAVQNLSRMCLAW